MTYLQTVAHACDICGSNAFTTFITHSDYEIVQCNNCKVSTTSPADYVTDSHYDATPQITELNMRGENKTRQYARKYLGFVRRHISHGRFLDIGCSTGVFVDEANRLGYEAEGIDLDSKAINYGKAQGRKVSYSSVESWPYREYQIVFLAHTLEHIAQPLPFLSSCVDHLSGGGYVAVIVPCHVGLHPRFFGKRWYGWLPSQHYVHYSPKALDILFRNAGLTPISIWQNSMDHKPRFEYIHNCKDATRSILSYSLATIGTLCGRGDQLIGIARKRSI